jgi:hypothetical protein
MEANIMERHSQATDEYSQLLSTAKTQHHEERDKLTRRSQELAIRGRYLTAASIGSGLLLFMAPVPAVIGAPLVAASAALGALHYYQSGRTKDMADHITDKLTALDRMDASQVNNLAQHLTGKASDIEELTKWVDRIRHSTKGRGIGL